MTEQPAEKPIGQRRAEARAVLEAALQEYVRVCREEEVTNLYVQDYVICVASESMNPGHENITYMNDINRLGMPTYAVLGLLHMGIKHYKAV